MKPNLVLTPRLTYPLALLVFCVSLGGLLIPDHYSRETANWAAQGLAQDWTGLFLLAPALAVATALAQRGSRTAALFLGGALFHSLYCFLIYTFAVHFNRLFLAYCACLSLSIFGLIVWLREMGEGMVASWFDTSRSNRFPVFFLSVNGALFLLLWLSEDIPAVLGGTAPASLTDGGFFTNPIHVLDYSFFLPAFLIAGILLWKRKPLGYLIFPVMLSFSILMAATVGFLAWYMALRGVAPQGPLPWVFAGVVAVSIGVLVWFYRGLKGKKN